MTEREKHTWDLWYPEAGARGLPFARGRLDATDVLLVHAAPPVLDVEVRDDEGQLVARASKLPSNADTPIARLTRHDETINREDIWPGPVDIRRPVILPGGEVGILLEWWNAPDESEWRWQIELYNHR